MKGRKGEGNMTINEREKRKDERRETRGEVRWKESS